MPVRVVSREVKFAHARSAAHALLEFRRGSNDMLEKLFRFHPAGAEMLERLHEANGRFLRIERNHPEPAEIQSHHGDMAVRGWIVAPHASEVRKRGELFG